MRGLLDRGGVAMQIRKGERLEAAEVGVDTFLHPEHLQELLGAERERGGAVRLLLLEPRRMLGERRLARVERGIDRGLVRERDRDRTERLAHVVVGELGQALGLQQRGVDPRARQRQHEVGAGLGEISGQRRAQLDHRGGALDGRRVVAEDVRVEVDRARVAHRVRAIDVAIDEVEQPAFDLACQHVALVLLDRRQLLGIEPPQRVAVALEQLRGIFERRGRAIRQHAVVLVQAERHRLRRVEPVQVIGDEEGEVLEPLRQIIRRPRRRPGSRRRAGHEPTNQCEQYDTAHAPSIRVRPADATSDGRRTPDDRLQSFRVAAAGIARAMRPVHACPVVDR
jgi:hypothetical protein